MRPNIDARSRAFYLFSPLLLASLFPAVQMLTSVTFSFLAGAAFDQAAAGDIRATAEYILTVTAVSQLLALAIIAGYSRAIRSSPQRFDRPVVDGQRLDRRRPGRRLVDGQLPDRPLPGRRSFRLTAAVAAPVLVLTVGAQMVEGSILSLFEIELGQYAEIAEIILEAHIAVVLVTVALIPGICEEVIFRGIIQPATVRGLGPVFGIVYTAAIFGVVHFVPVQIFAGFFFGIVFGYLSYRSGSVMPAIISHISANAIVAMVGRTSSGTHATAEAFTAETTSTGMLLAMLATGIIVAAAGVVWFETVIRRRSDL